MTKNIEIAVVISSLIFIAFLIGLLWFFCITINNFNEELWNVEKCNQFKEYGYATKLELWQNYVFQKNHICKIHLSGFGFVQATYACSKIHNQEICGILKQEVKI